MTGHPSERAQPLQLAAALRHLLFTCTPRIHRGKQLQIVDDKQAQQPLCPQRLGDDTQLVDVDVRCIVDMYRQRAHPFRRTVHILHLLRREPALTDTQRIGRTLRQYHALAQFRSRHLQREEHHRHTRHRRLTRKEQVECRLSVGRTRRRKNQVARLPSPCHLVQPLQARRHTRQPVHSQFLPAVHQRHRIIITSGMGCK